MKSQAITSGRRIFLEDGEAVSETIRFRVQPKTAELLDEYCQENGETRSNVLRNLLEKFLSKFSHL